MLELQSVNATALHILQVMMGKSLEGNYFDRRVFKTFPKHNPILKLLTQKTADKDVITWVKISNIVNFITGITEREKKIFLSKNVAQILEYFEGDFIVSFKSNKILIEYKKRYSLQEAA